MSSLKKSTLRLIKTFKETRKGWYSRSALAKQHLQNRKANNARRAKKGTTKRNHHR
jgi:hypothetical protein